MNCLVTKLKGVVDNDNLSKLNELTLTVHHAESVNASSQGIIFNFSKPVTIKALNGGHIATSYEDLTNNPQTEISIPRYTETTVYFENKDFKATISNKYAINTYRVKSIYINSNIGLDINELKYSSGLGVFYASGSYIVGDLSSIEDKISTISINAQNITGNIGTFTKVLNGFANNITFENSVNITGDIADVAFKPGLTSLTLTRSSIGGTMAALALVGSLTELRTSNVVTGTLEDFVEARRNKETPELTGSVTMRLSYGGLVTFNGVNQSGINSTLQWTANTITWNGTTINA